MNCRKLARHFAALFALTFTVIPPEATAGSFGRIKGRVTEKSSNLAIPFADVAVKGTRLGTYTKTDGTFSISGVAQGSQEVVVSIVGYASVLKRVTVYGDRTSELTVELEDSSASAPEIVVVAKPAVSAASAGSISAMDFELRPRLSSQDLLKLVPDLFIAQHAGGGKAEQIFLRGFDCDHGTDINIAVDGLPVNMVSHGHGQGYADLHFVMPEIVSGMEVYKGPYFAQFGDFATAGTVKFTTLDEIDHTSINIEGGEFDLARLSGLIRVPTTSENMSAYIAGEVLRNESYFDHSQNFRRYNLFGKLVARIDDEKVLSAWTSGFTSTWDASGQIPERAVAEGVIDRFGAIDPTEGGGTSRENVNIQYSQFGGSSGFIAQAYMSRYHFQLFSDFTFYKTDPVNGDEIEQDDDRTIAGGRAEYSVNSMFGNPDIQTVVGSSVRSDWIHNQLWHVTKRQRLQNEANADLHEMSFSLYVQQDYRLTRAIRLELGLRSDFFLFDVKDGLNAGLPGDITGYVTQSIIGPKGDIVYSPAEDWNLYFDAGSGFHSNDARAILAGGASTALPRAVGAEIGTRYTVPGMTVSLAFWGLDLQHELVYNGDDGTTEESGATRRLGIDLGLRHQLLEWLWTDLDMAVARGRYRNLPVGENYIPLAPTLSLTGGLTARHSSGIEATLRFRGMSDRPANEDNTVRARRYIVFDGGVAYSLAKCKLSCTVENLLNTQWNEAQFATESQLHGEMHPVTDLDFTPGTPLSLRARIEISF